MADEIIYEVRDESTMSVEFSIAPPGSPEFHRYTGGLVQRR